jgi:hypothetical protein
MLVPVLVPVPVLVVGAAGARNPRQGHRKNLPLEV